MRSQALATFTGLAAGASVVYALKQIGSAAFASAVELDKLGRTLTGVFGSRAALELGYLKAAATTFGKSLTETSRAYVKFAVAAESAGFATEATRRTFDATVKAVSKVGGSSEDVSGALLALSQMLSKGVVSAEEFRQQFGERVPGAAKLGANAMGLTMAEFSKLMESGKLASAEFVEKLTPQLEQFGAGWEATATGIQASTARVRDSFASLSDGALNLQPVLNVLDEVDQRLKTLDQTVRALNVKSKVQDAYDARILTSEQYKEALSLYPSGAERIASSVLSTVTAGLASGWDEKVRAEIYGASVLAETVLRQGEDNRKRLVEQYTEDYKRVAEERTKALEESVGSMSGGKQLREMTRQLHTFERELTRMAGKEYVLKLKMDTTGPLAQSLRELGMTEDQLRGAEDTFSRAASRSLTADSKYILDQRNARAKSAHESWLKEQYGLSDKSDATISQVGASLVTQARQAIADGVKYELGARDMATGKIDCSGFVSQINQATITGIEAQSKANLPDGLAQALTGTSESIITKVGKLTGETLKLQANKLDLSKIREGMLIGLDTGPTSFDAGRKYGIDHIAQFVKDANGVMQVIESRGRRGVTETDAEAWLKRFGDSVKAYVVDPYESMRPAWDRTLADYARGAKTMQDLQRETTDKVKEATLSEADYRRWALDQTIQAERQKAIEAGATAEELRAIDAGLADYKAATLQKIAAEEAQANAQQLQTARQHAQQLARVMQDLGEATGDKGLMREGLLSDIASQAQELKLLAKTQEEFDLIERQANLKAAQARRDTALDFGEYWSAMDELGAASRAAAEQEQDIWKEVLQTWIANSDAMAQARVAAYDQVIAKALEAGNTELAAQVQVAKAAAASDAALKKLQDAQQTGTPGEAFLARLSEGLEEFKDAATKARESAVEFADSVLALKSEAASALGQFGGDLMYGLLTGEAVGAFAELGDTAARAFSDKFASVLESQLNDIFDWVLAEMKTALSGMFSGGSGSGLLGGLFSSIFGGGFDSSAIWTGIEGGTFSTAGILASAKGNVFNAPGLSDYANKIVTRPTVFPFAAGGVPNLGLMGEAGPEAIMPLTRLPSGDLGVKASASGDSPQPITVNINKSPGTDVEVSQGDNGALNIEVLATALDGVYSRWAGQGKGPYRNVRGW